MNKEKAFMNKEKAYKILNISNEESKTLNKDLIRKKYLKACLKYHPDKNKENTNEMFVEINEAYKFLNHIQIPHNNTSPLFYMNDETILYIYCVIKNIYEPLYKHISILKTYTINVKLKQLLNKELYFLKDYDLYIPLWHHELLFETLNLKIKINVSLPEHVIIDDLNNINIYLDLSKKKKDELIKINIENLEFSFHNDNVFNKKIFKNRGIPIINDNNIYDHSTISDIIFIF